MRAYLLTQSNLGKMNYDLKPLWCYTSLPARDTPGETETKSCERRCEHDQISIHFP